MKKKTKQDILLAYLEGLSKNELIDLVIEFAPDSFKKEILAQDTPKEELSVCINEIASSMRFDIDDEELLYNPSEFQGMVSNYLEKLKPFVNSNCDEVFDIIFEMAIEIEDKYENGYLYIDHYYDAEEYFDFDVFTSEIITLIEKIKDSKKQTEILIEFQEICDNSGYMIFKFNDIKIKDKKALTSYFDEDSNMDFYLFIKELLPFEKREQFLLDYNSAKANLELVDLYIAHNQKDKAIALLESLIQKRLNLDYLKKLMELREVSSKEIREWLFRIINSNMDGLEFIFENIKKVENPKELELLLKKRNIDRYYYYLERYNRIDEMFEILDKVSLIEKEKFFYKYKKEYKAQAEQFFRAKIEKSLKYTGDYHYKTIADLLEHLKVIMDESSFISLVQQLKKDYKRRRNFIAILNKRFGNL